MNPALRISYFFLLGLLGACANTPVSQSVDETSPVTTWYAGTTSVFSADGKTPYGPPKEALVARTVDREKLSIVETVLDEGVMRTTTLRREGATNVFRAGDVENSFSGTITMRGSDWDFTGWSYDLSMTDESGGIVGSATIDATGIQTEKYFVSPDGQKMVKCVENLKVIPKAVYDDKVQAVLQP